MCTWGHIPNQAFGHKKNILIFGPRGAPHPPDPPGWGAAAPKTPGSGGREPPTERKTISNTGQKPTTILPVVERKCNLHLCTRHRRCRLRIPRRPNEPTCGGDRADGTRGHAKSSIQHNTIQYKRPQSAEAPPDLGSRMLSISDI